MGVTPLDHNEVALTRTCNHVCTATQEVLILACWSGAYQAMAHGLFELPAGQYLCVEHTHGWERRWIDESQEFYHSGPAGQTTLSTQDPNAADIACV